MTDTQKFPLKTSTSKSIKRRAKKVLDNHLSHGGSFEVEFFGKSITVHSGVLCPTYGEGSRMLGRCLTREEAPHYITPEDVVLDMGTGTGALAILAAQTARRVVATDVREESFQCALENVARNQLSGKVDVKKGDLFLPLAVSEKFSLILFNAPFMDGAQKIPLDYAWFDPGHKVLDSFMNQVSNFLTPDGRILLAFSTATSMSLFSSILAKSCFNWALVEKEHESGVTFFVVKLQRNLEK